MRSSALTNSLFLALFRIEELVKSIRASNASHCVQVIFYSPRGLPLSASWQTVWLNFTINLHQGQQYYKQSSSNTASISSFYDLKTSPILFKSIHPSRVGGKNFDSFPHFIYPLCSFFRIGIIYWTIGQRYSYLRSKRFIYYRLFGR